MSGWQPQGYDPRQQQRPVMPPQWGQAGQPDPWAGSADGAYRGAPPSVPPLRGMPPTAAQSGQPQWQPPPYRPQYAPPAPAPRKKRRVFLWVFLAVQVLFLIWIIAGAASHPAGTTVAQQVAQQCSHNGWYPLFKSQADCQVHYGHALNEASTAGKGIGLALIVVFWVVVDFFLGLGYGIYRLASRPR